MARQLFYGQAQSVLVLALGTSYATVASETRAFKAPSRDDCISRLLGSAAQLVARNFHTPHCALLLDLRAVRGYYLHVHQHVLLAPLTTARASQLAHPAQPVQRSVLPSPASVADPQHLRPA